MKRLQCHFPRYRLTGGLLLVSFVAVGFLCCEREHETAHDDDHHHHLLLDDAPALPSVRAATVLDDASWSMITPRPDPLPSSEILALGTPDDLRRPRPLYFEHAALLL